MISSIELTIVDHRLCWISLHSPMLTEKLSSSINKLESVGLLCAYHNKMIGLVNTE